MCVVCWCLLGVLVCCCFGMVVGVVGFVCRVLLPVAPSVTLGRSKRCCVMVYCSLVCSGLVRQSVTPTQRRWVAPGFLPGQGRLCCRVRTVNVAGECDCVVDRRCARLSSTHFAVGCRSSGVELEHGRHPVLRQTRRVAHGGLEHLPTVRRRSAAGCSCETVAVPRRP